MEGYVRQNGRPGIRNTVQVIFMVECASHVAKKIAEGFPCHDVQYFGFSGCYPSDYGYRLVKNLAIHSNVGGVLIISLGCENFDRRRLEQEVRVGDRAIRWSFRKIKARPTPLLWVSSWSLKCWNSLRIHCVVS